jgi:hypothetical protein
VVDVRVCQDNGFDRRRIDREDCPVTPAQLGQPLKLPAVDQDAATVHLEQVFRARDGARGTKKRQRSHHKSGIRCQVSGIRRRAGV